MDNTGTGTPGAGNETLYPVIVKPGHSVSDLTPRQVVAELDKYIIGQAGAKRVVAVALRNRLRRMRVSDDIKNEIVPKNILMIGPTGVGKTEIARRIALLTDAPFVKVEATKYTEVGYVGRDVESMVRDLIEAAIRMVRKRMQEEVAPKAEASVIDQILDIMQPPTPSSKKFSFGGSESTEQAGDEPGRELTQIERMRKSLRRRIERGDLDDHIIEVEISDHQPQMLEIFSNSGMEEMGVNLQNMLGNIMPGKTKKRKVTIGEARKMLLPQESAKLIDEDAVKSEAVLLAEQSGIIFIDEIDKIAVREGRGGGQDVSREGVQRDILPIVEGCTVMTKYGPVRTDHVLFIAAGAFSISKPSDLIPELQGRLPLRVELDSLTEDDFKRILTEPRNALTRQYEALLGADGVDLAFTTDGITEIAATASRVNSQTENIGARRLHTILEKVLEDVSFQAPDELSGSFVIDSPYVRKKLHDVMQDIDLSRYIL